MTDDKGKTDEMGDERALPGKLYSSVLNYGLRLKTSCCTEVHNRHEIPPTFYGIMFSFINSFLGILVLSRIDKVCVLEDIDIVMIVGSFGAQATLIFSAPNSHLAQPWNCIGGNAVSSIVGVSVYRVFDYFDLVQVSQFNWVAAALGVSLAITAMLLTRSLHPPGGATALIAITGSSRIHDLGYMYVLFPAIIGSCIFVSMGILLNSMSSLKSRQYPMHWLPWLPLEPVDDCCHVDTGNAKEEDNSDEPCAGNNLEMVSNLPDAETVLC